MNAAKRLRPPYPFGTDSSDLLALTYIDRNKYTGSVKYYYIERITDYALDDNGPPISGIYVVRREGYLDESSTMLLYSVDLISPEELIK